MPSEQDIEKLHQELERLRKLVFYDPLTGEEFVAALLGANVESARKVGEDLRAELEKREIAVGDQTVKVTISLGVAGYDKEKNLDELLNRADQAMHEAKRQGKNRVTVAVE